MTYRTNVGDRLRDWRRGDRVVVAIWRAEDLGRFTDGWGWRGSTAERCALHGGATRPQDFGVRE